MPAVGEQPVGDVQGGAGLAAQGEAQTELRGRRPVARQQRFGHLGGRRSSLQHQFQRRSSLAERAPTQSRSPGRAPARVSAWPAGTLPNTVRVMLSGPRVVSPPTRARPHCRAMASRPRAKPCNHSASACGKVRARVKARARRPSPLQVAGGDRQGALGKKERVATGGKMHAFHQGIGGGRQLFAGWRRQQGAVVADAEGHVRRRRRAGGRGEEAADQLELTR